MATYLSWNGFDVDRIDGTADIVSRLSGGEYGLFICDVYLDPAGGRKVCLDIRKSTDPRVRDTRIMLVGPEPSDPENCRFHQENGIYFITAYRRVSIWLDKISVILSGVNRERQ